MRKVRTILSLLLALCMVLAMFPVFAHAAAGVWGDATGEGEVDNVDAMRILQYSVGLVDEAALDFDVCDVNDDGAVDNVDAMLILQKTVGLIEKFPVEGSPADQDALAEAEIRRAISLLIDRNYIANDIGGGQVAAASFVPMGMTDADGSQFYQNAGSGSGYYDVSAEAYEDNAAEAMEILSKYYEVDENGKLLNFPTLTYLFNESYGHQIIGESIMQDLANVGIDIDLASQEWGTFLETRKNGEFSIARNGWLADYNDPISFLDMWTSGSGNNDVQFGKGDHADVAIYNLDLTAYGYDVNVKNGTWAETYDKLISIIKNCTVTETRYKLMHLAEDMLMETGAVIPLYYYTDVYMLDDSVEGFYASPLGLKFFQNTTVNGSNSRIDVILGSEPNTLDPALNSAVDAASIISHLFAGLAKWDTDANGNLTIVADCAEALPEGVVNADGTVTYTYTLKEGQKWSDGVALTAHDFEYAWKRAASSELGADYGYMFEVIKGYPNNLAVEAVDDKTLTVTLNSYVTYWNELLAFSTYFPVREDVVSNKAWATNSTTYVSNGAYTMSSWEHNAHIALVKNENYHDAANVTMKLIEFQLSDDSNSMLESYKSGSVKVIDDVPANQVAAVKAEFGSEFVVAGQLGTYYACWNINEDLLP